MTLSEARPKKIQHLPGPDTSAVQFPLPPENFELIFSLTRRYGGESEPANAERDENARY